jgi:hypothetical protein
MAAATAAATTATTVVLRKPIPLVLETVRLGAMTAVSFSKWA